MVGWLWIGVAGSREGGDVMGLEVGERAEGNYQTLIRCLSLIFNHKRQYCA